MMRAQRVSAKILKEWIDSGTTSTVVMVTRVERDDSGGKIITISAPPMVNG